MLFHPQVFQLFLFLTLIFIVYWTIVDLQCCVSSVQLIQLYIHIFLSFFFFFLSVSLFGFAGSLLQHVESF